MRSTHSFSNLLPSADSKLTLDEALAALIHRHIGALNADSEALVVPCFKHNSANLRTQQV